MGRTGLEFYMINVYVPRHRVFATCQSHSWTRAADLLLKCKQQGRLRVRVFSWTVPDAGTGRCPGCYCLDISVARSQCVGRGPGPLAVMNPHGLIALLLTACISRAVGENSGLKVAVCSEGYPPYIEPRGSNYVGYELGNFRLMSECVSG